MSYKVPVLFLGAIILATALFAMVWVISVGSDLLESLPKSVGEAQGKAAGSLLILATVIGVFSMALIQIVRGVYPIRGLFQQLMALRWLAPGVRHAPEDVWHQAQAAKLKQRQSDSPPNTSAIDMALSDLIELAVAGDSRALFDLPIEKLCGQISAAAEQVLDEPNGKELLLYGLAGKAGKDDANVFLSHTSIGEGEITSKLVDARNAVAHRIQRNIDGLQISTSLPWRRGLRIAATGMSMLMAYGLTADVTGLEREVTSLERTVTVLFCGLAGGFLATVARDVTALLERHRR